MVNATYKDLLFEVPRTRSGQLNLIDSLAHWLHNIIDFVNIQIGRRDLVKISNVLDNIGFILLL